MRKRTVNDGEHRLRSLTELRDDSGMDASSQTSNGSQVAEAARRKWSVEDRLRIVQASLKKGTTVDAVAKVYGVHARQLYDWRKQHRQGLLGNEIAAMLPVQVAEASRCAVPEPPSRSRTRVW